MSRKAVTYLRPQNKERDFPIKMMESEGKNLYFICLCTYVCECAYTCDCACVHILAVLDIQLRTLHVLDKYSTPSLQSQPLMSPPKAAFTVKNLCFLFTVGHMGC